MEESDNLKNFPTIERSINGLRSSDKSVVKQSISEISKIVSRTDSTRRIELYDVLEKPLIIALQGNVESCREKTIHIINSFIKDLDVDRKYLNLLIPALHNRVGTDDVKEPSEEIRDAVYDLLNDVVEKYADHLDPYMDDIVAILSRGIKDSAPAVKRSCCKCTVSLSSLAPQQFYPFTKNLIEPLRDSITHQHWRVRVAVIEAIGNRLNYLFLF